MKANPGGTVSPSEAIGREKIVEEIWSILEAQSIYMNAERRIGKTTILRILQSNPKHNWVPIFQDLEKCHTVEEFAAEVYRQVDEFLGLTARAKRRGSEWLAKVGGTEIGGVITLPEGKQGSWKNLLEKCIEDLHEAQEEQKKRVVFLWDEVPFMLDNIRKRQRENTAMEVLDILRYIRQTYPKVRMVITGSIGLHHVLSTLKGAGYANSPINDMTAMEVQPISAVDGAKLARQLLEGENVACENIDALSKSVSGAVDHFPYYIQHLVRQIKFSGKKATAELVEEIILNQLSSPNDPWELKHYRKRISTYFGEKEEKALAILDSVASAHEGIDLSALHNELSGLGEPMDKEPLRELLGLLEQDHYIRRSSNGYKFYSPLIRRWWRMDRSLE